MAYRNCKVCGDKFYAKPFSIKRGWGIYCSAVCHYKDMMTGKKKTCDICGAMFYRDLGKLGRSKSGKFFCSKSCQAKWRNTEFSGPKHKLWKGGQHTYQRIMAKKGGRKICRLCDENDTRVIAIHHIDEDRKNNMLGNLAWLCHNCHHLVHCDSLEKRRLFKASNMVPVV